MIVAKEDKKTFRISLIRIKQLRKHLKMLMMILEKVQKKKLMKMISMNLETKILLPHLIKK